jgi:thiamine-phosphate pyrophosphorylase
VEPWGAGGPPSAFAPRLIAVTDLAQASLDDHLVAYASLLAGAPPGAAWVQLRMPASPAGPMVAAARRLRPLLDAHRARLIVNDRLDVARAVGADAVHLGRTSVSVAEARALLGPAAWVSVACHGAGDLAAAVLAGADAALLSPIFSSPGKGPAMGLEGLGRAVAGARLPVLALGGVDGAGAASCLAAGAAGVAAIRGALDPAAWAPFWTAIGARGH